jgi:hypothetical protein
MEETIPVNVTSVNQLVVITEIILQSVWNEIITAVLKDVVLWKYQMNSVSILLKNTNMKQQQKKTKTKTKY